jgi:hypothetical protein
MGAGGDVAVMVGFPIGAGGADLGDFFGVTTFGGSVKGVENRGADDVLITGGGTNAGDCTFRGRGEESENKGTSGSVAM